MWSWAVLGLLFKSLAPQNQEKRERLGSSEGMETQEIWCFSQSAQTDALNHLFSWTLRGRPQLRFSSALDILSRLGIPRYLDSALLCSQGLEVTDEEKELEITLAPKQNEKSTYSYLQSVSPIRKVAIHGECITVPERYFKPDWKNTLEIQGCTVVHCPGGSVYLVRKKNEAVVDHEPLRTQRKIKKMAKTYLKSPIQS